MKSDPVPPEIAGESSSCCAKCGEASLIECGQINAQQLHLLNEDDCFWIQCDICERWYHGKCVSVEEYESAFIDQYHCFQCHEERGPSALKNKRNDHRYSFEEEADDKVTQIGTKRFVREFKHQQDRFAVGGDVVRYLEDGSYLTFDFLEKTKWDRPICVRNKNGLGFKLPDSNFDVRAIAEILGDDYRIDAIDVYKQHSYRMSLGRYLQIWDSTTRDRIYNVLSLEFSTTKLTNVIDLPSVVTDISWVHKFWPDHSDDHFHGAAEVLQEHLNLKPHVAMFCLIGMKDSYTDFHIDFGGSSVWYHVFKGEKIFYLVEPTESHLALFKDYMKNPRRSEQYFADNLAPDACVRVSVKAGETVLIPSGWIHAVLTPVDSLVFGGNFLHSLDIDMQLRVHEMEVELNTDERYMFPSFELTNWYAARSLVELFADANEDKRLVPGYQLHGAKSLLAALRRWMYRDKVQKKNQSLISYGKTVQQLQKEINAQEKVKKQLSKLNAAKRAPAKRKSAPKETKVTVEPKPDELVPETQDVPTKKRKGRPKSKKQKAVSKEPKTDAVEGTVADIAPKTQMDTSLQLKLRVPTAQTHKAPLKLKFSLSDNILARSSLDVERQNSKVILPPTSETSLKLSFGIDRFLQSPNKINKSVISSNDEMKEENLGWSDESDANESGTVGFSLLDLQKSKEQPIQDAKCATLVSPIKAGHAVEAAVQEIVTPPSQPKPTRGLDMSNLFGVSSHGRVQKPNAWVMSGMVEYVPELGQHCHEDNEFVYPSLVDADDRLQKLPPKRIRSVSETQTKPVAAVVTEKAKKILKVDDPPKSDSPKPSVGTKKKGMATTKQRLASKLKIRKMMPM